LHRLLEWSYQGFLRDEGNPLDADVVFVDESSMIDIELCADLLRAVRAGHTRVVFVGDADQLPPVGPGAPFRDLIASEQVPTVRLETVHRAAEKSWIYRNAPNILAGSGVELADCEDFEFHELGATDGGYLGAACLDIIHTLQAEGYGPQDYQVLVPMRKRDAGTSVLNPYFQEALNPGQRAFQLSADVSLSEGDCVIQTKNDYGLSVMNGEVGRIEEIDAAARTICVQYPALPGSSDDGFRRYSRPKELRNLDLAYALTVHKFQGSQVPVVIFICHTLHKFMLSRQLLYTALTRARKRVYLVGDEGGVSHALRTIRDTQRRTRLQERLCA
jgi:exodeoxyribonuclease V alpha subunit